MNEPARVTVSMELKDNNFGKGYGAFVSVSLPCAEDDIVTTHGAATEMTGELLEQTFQEAHRRFKRNVPA